MHDTVSLGLHKLFSITATSTVSRVLVIGLNGPISKKEGVTTMKKQSKDAESSSPKYKTRITHLNDRVLDIWKTLWGFNTINKNYKIEFQEVVEANYIFFQEEAKHNSSKNFAEKGKIVRRVKISALVIGLLSLCIFVMCMLYSRRYRLYKLSPLVGHHLHFVGRILLCFCEVNRGKKIPRNMG